MFPTLFRLASQASEAAESSVPAASGPFQLKKVWPPDFTKLSPQAQLRFEKKYKRRVALKHARPRWNKAIKLVQLVTVTGALGALFFTETTLFGRPYRPSDQVSKRRILTVSSRATGNGLMERQQAIKYVKSVFGAVDPEKRYERRADAPAAPSPRNEPK
ncbi:hypothetical protein SODALDRAFT_78397 [Sodiomyces alkalinus F11]|uniref:Uncharacterized protein n=1 Tax=Sodiomyces alkalinus (strain CBS 110278 / VKM F-3762 / F11) TaxID=1314773 RepID=A0A3N2PKU4_SODAK|nr:hypothetical protein SODALDRAFT_78397 [Sodiomyces alkalinus F11]ROT35142.1 hypothetical protein SODALDRAFT_78397 [Sodiomyces alkalinus F11]